jgi:hypothetical protein
VLASPDLPELTAGFIDVDAGDIDWVGLGTEALSWPERERFLVAAAYRLYRCDHHTLNQLLHEQLGGPGHPGQRLNPSPSAQQHLAVSDRQRLQIAARVCSGELSPSAARDVLADGPHCG